MAARKLLILVGEASGDLQGGQLVRALRPLAPDLDLVAMGGPCLRESGARLVLDTTSQGFIGVWEAVCGYPTLLRLFARVKQLIAAERPDHVVFIDAPGFNMRLAPFVRALGIPSTYYFPPSAWVPDLERARQVGRRVNHVVAAFEQTACTYRKAGVPVAYFGHPLLDVTPRMVRPSTLVESLGLPPGKRYVGLFPGSRRGELDRLLGCLLETARRLAHQVPDLHFVLPVAIPRFAERIRRQVAGFPDLALTVVDGRGTDCMAVCDLLLMSSGSASLEAAILGIPMVLTYRLSAFDWALAPFVLRDFRFMGLPNLLAGRYVVPELLQEDARPECLAREAVRLLTDPALAARMRDDLAQVKDSLGTPGVSARVARYLWEEALQ